MEFVARQPMEPLTLYRIWFKDVAACMGRRDEATIERFGRIRWFTAAEIRDARLGPHQNIWGSWIPPHEITIRTDALLDRVTVTHELVHDFLQTTSHDSRAFAECAPPCLTGTCDT